MPTLLRALPSAALCCALLAACGPASHPTGAAPETDADADAAVTVEPAGLQLLPRETVAFAAEVAGAPGAVTWSIDEGTRGGTITPDGVYTAPADVGEYHVVATSAAAPDRSGTATVTVTAAPVVRVAVAPRAASLGPGASASFSAAVTGTADGRVAWSVAEGAAGGAVSAAGVYTAPQAPSTYHVRATSLADPTRSDAAVVTVTAAPADLATQLAALSTKAIWFGHRSVGADVMDGVRALLAENGGAEPAIVTTASAAAVDAGTWAESLNGQNFDPIGKLDAFDATLRAGMGARVDVGFLKLCWVDFNDASAHFAAGGTAAGLFAAYRQRLDALAAAYPGVTFVHVTAPLVTDAHGDAPWNPRREAYNDLLRATYGGVAPVFDLALLESTDPGGARVVGTHGYALYPGYSSDGGHLNAAGRDVIARALVALLAAP